MDKLRDTIENVGLSKDPIVYNRLILFAESHKVYVTEHSLILSEFFSALTYMYYTTQ